jgi:sugar transferase (PEP-CTERM system associated)
MFFLKYLAFQRVGAVIVEHALLVVCVLLNVSHFGVALAPHTISVAFIVAVTFQLFLHLRDVYQYGKRFTSIEFAAGFGQAILFASAVLCLLHLIKPGLFIGPGNMPVMLLTTSLVLMSWHLAVRLYLDANNPRSTVLIMGTGPLALALATELERHHELGFSLCGFVDDDPDLVGGSIGNPKVIGPNQEVRRIVSQNRVDRVIVETRDRRGRLPISDLLELKMNGVRVEEATSVYERVTGKISIENLKPSWMVFGEGFEVSRRVIWQQRIISFLASLFLFLLFIPLFPIIILLIAMDSPGPVFFRQERVGQNGKTFTLWKFRSMRHNAEQDTGPVWARPGDSRITRVGKFLRKTRLDELPQLINVLKGDMNLVGPRPERPKFVADLSQAIPFYYLRHSVKPGLTGWAQINYGYGNSVQDAIEKLQHDLFYIKNISTALDLVIILNTVKTVLLQKGS